MPQHRHRNEENDYIQHNVHSEYTFVECVHVETVAWCRGCPAFVDWPTLEDDSREVGDAKEYTEPDHPQSPSLERSIWIELEVE